ncbi:MAG: acetyl-CoA carboxylase biotin carboxyl carrier protein subunit [Elusimicrobia bacterium]|nr:acetyl-CoA carboxylase biotin carboxyl carrier protein subunit [Elusimicrobiota bacterium]
MNTQEIEEVLSWLKGTDLVEVSYRQGQKGFSLATSESSAAPHYPIPASRFTPIASPAVGVFQWSEPGRPRQAEEGAEVAAGQGLGLVETGKGKSAPVTAPSAGRLARVMVEAGAAVEFDQPLFFLEPAA